MRRLLAVAALILASGPALAAGAFVTKRTQTPAGALDIQYYDLSGVGIGPFVPVYVCSDGNGNLCAAGGGGGGSTTLNLPSPVTMTVTNTPIAAGGTATIAANSNRKYLTFVNGTPGPCRYGYGSFTPSATAGMPLAAGQPFTLEASSISQQAVPFYCAQAGTIDITEGQ